MEQLVLAYGGNEEVAARRVLEKLKVEEELRALGKSPLIGIKPNLVVAQPAGWGATTSPRLVRGVIGYLLEKGFGNIIVLESSWVSDCTQQAFTVCGYREIEREFGVPLVDLKKDKFVRVTVEDLEFLVCARALAVDYLINMPVLKAHCQTRLTCALKNLKGCIPDSEKKRFHRLGLHYPIACLNRALKSHLVVVDGVIGDLAHEEGGTPVRMDRVIAGRDPVAVDAYAAGLLGYRREDVPYIGMAEALGVGSTKFEIVELEREKGRRVPEAALAGREVEYLSRWIEEEGACSPCYGSVVQALMRLKETGKLKGDWKIGVGQGCRGKTGMVGAGECAAGFAAHAAGCPPRARDIVEVLEAWLAGKWGNAKE